MAVQSTPVYAGEFPVMKVIAIVAWVAGLSTTHMAIAALLGAPVPWYIAFGSAIVAQIVITALEYLFFNVKSARNEVGAIALIFDVAFNAGGLYDPMTRIGATPIGHAIADSIGVQPTVGKIAALIIAGIIGYLLARAPEYLWQA